MTSRFQGAGVRFDTSSATLEKWGDLIVLQERGLNAPGYAYREVAHELG